MYPMLMAGVPCTQSSRCSFFPGVPCTHSFAAPSLHLSRPNRCFEIHPVVSATLEPVLPRCQSATVLLSSPFGLALHRPYLLSSEYISACCSILDALRLPDSTHFPTARSHHYPCIWHSSISGVQHSQRILLSFLSSFSFSSSLPPRLC